MKFNQQDEAANNSSPSAISNAERAHLLFYSQAASPDKEFVAYSTNFGHIILCDITRTSSTNSSIDGDVPVQLPSKIIKATDKDDGNGIAGGIYSLATVATDRSHNGFLAAGYANGVLGYAWSDLLRLDDSPISPRWRLDSSGATVNSLAPLFANEANQLIVGCEDGCVRLYDLGHGGCLLRTWSFDNSTRGSGNPSNMTNSLSPILRVATAASASSSTAVCSDEAGFVRLLDARQRSVRASFQPALAAPETVARPGLGNWLTCLACRTDSADWFACGGGPRLAIWHSANLTEPAVTVAWQPEFESAPTANATSSSISIKVEFTPFCAEFSPCDRLLVGGNSSIIGQISSVTGDLVAKSRLSCRQTLSVACLGPPLSDMKSASVRDWRFTGCGLGSRIDVCSQLGYRLFSIDA